MSVLLHILALWMVVAALPLFDVLGRSPEFFVAHRTRPADIWLFVALLSLAVPLLVYGLVRASSLISARLPKVITAIFVGTMAAVMALQVVKQLGGLSVGPALTTAAVAAVVASVAYGRLPGVRWATTFLAPAIVIVPALFLWQPGVRSQLAAGTVQAVDLAMARTPPVVVMVFDQLPLASLLDADLQIDGRRYPNFAGFGREATWFRNASAVSGYTDWALPAIMSGQRPHSSRTPAASDYPENLFTLLGGRYDLKVFEPLTSLCPETLCETTRASMSRIMQDVGVVFLHLVAPGYLADRLPPVTQGWRDFAAADSTGERWQAARLGDRGPVAEAFIDAIDGASDPSTPLLIFMHVLIPHEPFVYLPSGQLATTRPTSPGYQSDGTWSGDLRAVRHSYQRHLSQIGYADTLLGRLLDRVRSLGLYDDALIVVAADHGMSFRPRHSVRELSRDALADIMSVPLLIKHPGQQIGAVDDSNVETVDVLPTILRALGAVAPASIDGADAFATDRRRPAKAFARTGAGRVAEVEGSLLSSLAEAVGWKVDLVGEESSPFSSEADRYSALVGQAVSGIRTRPQSDVEVTVDVPVLFSSIDPAAYFVPAHMSGAIRRRGTGGTPPLAVAVNGVVGAIAKSFEDPVAGRPDSWEVLLDPALFAAGPNDVEVLAIVDEPDGSLVLERAWRQAGEPSAGQNLISEGVALLRRAASSGFHNLESVGPSSYRWTDGAARLDLPVEPGREPATLAVDVTMGPPDTHLRVTANECVLVDEPTELPWSEEFSIDDCVADARALTIEIVSNTFVPGGADQRTLGVAVARIELK